MREITIGAVSGLVGIVFGIAVCPKQTGTPMDGFPNYVSGFYVLPDGSQRHKHAFMCDFGNRNVQAILLERRSTGSRVIGVEYYISEYTWKDLTIAEREEWHSCSFSVKSGLTVTPDFAKPFQEDVFYEKLSKCYVKTIIFWHSSSKTPDSPVLARPILTENEINQNLVDDRDKDLNINTAQIAKSRSRNYNYIDRRTTTTTRSK